MNQSLGLDFGTSNTLINLSESGSSFSLPEFSKVFLQGSQQVEMIPSLIHYTSDRRRWIGAQVHEKGLYDSNRTFRWMKRYISQRSPLKVIIDDREITPSLAARDFLSTLLGLARRQIPASIDSVGMSVPVESFEHYESWLTQVVHDSGFDVLRLIDEPSAAALGYGEHIQPGHVYLIFDFGGGTMHASVVRIEKENDLGSNNRCRVLGKAARDIGGSSIDCWLFESILSSVNLNPSYEKVITVSNRLLVDCEKAKETLSEIDLADISIFLPESDPLTVQVSRHEFEMILDEHRLFFDINQTIRSALNGARERGYAEDSIHSVLMIGGSSLIPSVRKCLEQIFGTDRVHSDRPMNAIAQGAARLACGDGFYDFIQHDYAIRYSDPAAGNYAYKTIVRKGTSYPSTEAEAVLTIKGAYTGQQKLGLAIFEVGPDSNGRQDNMELVFDPNGNARIMPLTSYNKEQRQFFWMNEKSPTFIHADPPVQPGQARFELKFYINHNKQLLVSVIDLLLDKMILDRVTVMTLS